MQVYVIPQDKLALWVSPTFRPIEDAFGNFVVAVDADYSQHSFNDELIKCEIIKYVPPIIKDLP
jgi:hypothetical protein